MLAKPEKPTVIVGAGMAGLAAAMALAAAGEPVTLLEMQAYPGGKMRQLAVDKGIHDRGQQSGIDSGPTVFTMKWVFERLFAACDTTPERELTLTKAEILARHAWQQPSNSESSTFDLFADEKASIDSVGRFFDAENAKGFQRFSKDAATIFETLRDTFIAAPRPSPIGLGRRVGLSQPSRLFALRPFSTLWGALGDYFPDPRLRQLFGRYATYVGSSPYMAPATLMLIAHVEQAGVWTIDGGMHALAKAMRRLAKDHGANIRETTRVTQIETEFGAVTGVRLANGERIDAARVLWCGDVSALTRDLFSERSPSVPFVKEQKRSLSAITWSARAKTSGMELDHHNVLFSNDYKAEFDCIFERSLTRRQVPQDPTVYICAQDRKAKPGTQGSGADSALDRERLLCLINAPAFGDRRTLTHEELATCQTNMQARLQACGLTVELEPDHTVITQPSDFNTLFPGSGGALYGRASHGWTASFARPGSKTKLPGLYLAGGSVHPGAGVPMATLSGMLAAQQIIKDRVSN
ncbi:MAG: 1-hydroxycarotenoid 3,4-desaturase CrtD [Pseudomonadota bacterium]